MRTYEHTAPCSLCWYLAGCCKCYEATDEPGTTVRVLFLDYSKAFDLINHETLINKLVAMNLPAHINRWMADFLLTANKQLRLVNLYHNQSIPMEVSHKERCRGPIHFWCILTIYAHLVLFISTPMTVPYLKYSILLLYWCYSSPLPLLLIGLLTMECE